MLHTKTYSEKCGYTIKKSFLNAIPLQVTLCIMFKKTNSFFECSNEGALTHISAPLVVHTIAQTKYSYICNNYIKKAEKSEGKTGMHTQHSHSLYAALPSSFGDKFC